MNYISPKIIAIETPRDRADAIVQRVALAHRVNPKELWTNAKRASISHARQEAMAAIREELKWSLPHIGRYFGGRHHATVIYAIAKHHERISYNTKSAS